MPMYSHKAYAETLVHQCADADRYTLEHRQEIACIQRHDVSTYMWIPEATTVNGKSPVRYGIMHIKHCPYCGCNLDNDPIAGELKMRLGRAAPTHWANEL